MIHISSATVTTGSDEYYPEESPKRDVKVQGFFIDQCPVTNSEFGAFVEDTGYVSEAERAAPRGSLVFTQPRTPCSADNWRNWWSFVPGACWHTPLGPGSNLVGLQEHPVVHVALADTLAFANWSGKDLPTEAEWELAARGGLVQAPFAWGDELFPNGAIMANIWHGQFPWENTKADGYSRTSPVGAFPPNSFGLYDMIGNVWEWTRDAYRRHPSADQSNPCCCPGSHSGPQSATYNVIKGGSHLCAQNYCQRYRPAARLFQDHHTSTSHLGFRCVIRTKDV